MLKMLPRRRFMKRRIIYVITITMFVLVVMLVQGDRKFKLGSARSGKQYASVHFQKLHLKRDYDDRYVVYNRVPKCGSMSMTTMSYRLGAEHGFKVASPYKDGEKPNLSENEQIEFVKYLHAQQYPYMHIRHQYFIDFEKFGEKQPIYINMIRDPIERFESFYYFSRFGNQGGGGGSRLGDQKTQETIDECVSKKRQECTKPYWQVVPYFCGQDPGCMSRSRWSVNRAKENIEKHYVFVGVLEELDDSLKILEKLLPQYFKSASEYMKIPHTMKIRNETYTRNKMKTSETAKKFLRTQTSLSLEYELYEFVLNRVYQIKDTFV